MSRLFGPMRQVGPAAPSARASGMRYYRAEPTRICFLRLILHDWTPMPLPIPAAATAKDNLETRHPAALRRLASWYREFAERTENPAIWEARLQMAGDLEAEADRIEARR